MTKENIKLFLHAEPSWLADLQKLFDKIESLNTVIERVTSPLESGRWNHHRK